MEYDAERVAEATIRLLEAFGADIGSPELKDTPKRVAASWQELLSGYEQEPRKILSRVFEDSRYDEMVMLDGIDFESTCEHHLLPFSGQATVAYIPEGGRVVGLSKLARIVDCFARRLQMQERMTVQIAEAINTHLQPKGVGVVAVAKHHCLGCRGVKKPGARMMTSCLLGVMRDDGARSELFSLCRRAQ